MGLSKTSFLHNGPLDNSMIMGGRVVMCKIRTPYSRCAPFLFPPTKSCVRVSSCEPLQASKENQEIIFIIVIVPRVRGSQIFHMQDIWVDQCLKRFVQAKRVFNAKLLSEAHCDPSPGAVVKFQSSKFGFQLGSIKASWANWVPFYTTHHAWAVYHVAGWQDCKDPSRVAFHPFKTDSWPWKWVEPGENGL